MLSNLNAQEKNDIIKSEAPNIFIDCHRCDETYIIDEISYVNYVRDRKDADIHLLFTDEITGGGGREYTITYIGQKKFEGMNDTLKFSTNLTESEDEIRNKMVRTIKLGLVRYLLKTPVAQQLSVAYSKPSTISSIQEDEWDYWVYSAGIHSFLRGEQSSNFINLWGSLSARRITEAWKFKISFSGSYNEDHFDYGDTKIVNISRSQNFETGAVKSLDQHWSLVLWGEANSSTYRNTDYRIAVIPGVEYNYFPYSESTRRKLTIQYGISPNIIKYRSETIYFKQKEFLIEHLLSVSLELIQPWGNIETTLTGMNYLKNFSMNAIELFSEINMKLFKGLSLDIEFGISRVHNQLSLPKTDATLEEVLLQRRELETQYEYWGSFGFSYSFGSIYNNVVNPRFGNLIH